MLRRRASPGQRATATACLLAFLSAAAVLLASDLFEFSWRYQLPALVTLPPAGALGITVIIGYATARAPGAQPGPAAGPVPGRPPRSQRQEPRRTRRRPAEPGLFGVLPARPGPEPGRGEPHDQGQRDQQHDGE